MWGCEMRQMVEKLMRQYGTDVTILHGGESRAVRAFFQPVQSTSWQSMAETASPLGMVSQGQYSYIGPAGEALEPGDILRLGEKSYLLRREEVFCAAGEPVYRWGLWVERSEESQWPI